MGVASTRIGPSNRLTGRSGGWTPGSLGPTFWIDAAQSVLGETAVSNLGTGGSALNAVFGNSTGVDSFDPQLLTHTGTNYMYLPGLISNFASTPSNAPLNLTDDCQFVFRVSTPTWSAAQLLLAKPFSTGGYYVSLSATTIDFVYSLAVTPTVLSSASVTWDRSAVAANTVLWIRLTRVSSTGAVTLDYAADQPSEPTTWTTVGSSGARPSGAIATNTNVLGIGGNSSSSNWTGAFYRTIVRHNGTTVFDADFTTGITSGSQITFTESSANAATVTINRSTSGRKAVAVTRPILLFGTDDYLEVAADPNGAYLQTTGAANSNAFAPYVSFDTGTCTGGAGTTSTTLEDTTKAWVVNDRAQRMVRITGGTGVGQIRSIASNTATQLTVSVAWTTIPDATSTYVIESRGNVGGDIEIVVRCALDNWATGLNQPLVVKRATGHYSYYAYMSGAGAIGFAYSIDGATQLVVGTGVAPFTNGTAYWIRIRRTASTGAWTTEYAADQPTEPTTWTPLASGTFTAGNIWQGTAEIVVGGTTAVGAFTAGKFYAAIVREGTLAHVVWYAYGHSTASATYANTQRLAFQVGSAASIVNGNPLNFGASDSFTVIAVARRWTAPPVSGVFISKWSNGGGWHMRNGFGTPTQPLIALNNGVSTTNSAMPTPTLGGVDVFAAVVGPTNVVSYWNNTAFTTAWTPISTSSEVPVSIGRVPFGSSYNDVEMLATMVIPRTLSAGEIAQLVSYYMVGA